MWKCLWLWCDIGRQYNRNCPGISLLFTVRTGIGPLTQEMYTISEKKNTLVSELHLIFLNMFWWVNYKGPKRKYVKSWVSWSYYTGYLVRCVGCACISHEHTSTEVNSYNHFFYTRYIVLRLFLNIIEMCHFRRTS